MVKFFFYTVHLCSRLGPALFPKMKMSLLTNFPSRAKIWGCLFYFLKQITSVLILKAKNIWARRLFWVFAGRRFFMWASTQSDQNLCCPPKETLGPLLLIKQTGWMPRLIWVFAAHTGRIAGFVMLQLMLFSNLLSCGLCQNILGIWEDLLM